MSLTIKQLKWRWAGYTMTGKEKWCKLVIGSLVIRKRQDGEHLEDGWTILKL